MLYCMAFLWSVLKQYYCSGEDNYLRQGGNVFARVCLFVCLSVCLSVSKITKKIMDGSF